MKFTQILMLKEERILFSFSGLRLASFHGMKRQKAFLRHPTLSNGRTNIQKLIGKGILMSVLKFVKTF